MDITSLPTIQLHFQIKKKQEQLSLIWAEVVLSQKEYLNYPILSQSFHPFAQLLLVL